MTLHDVAAAAGVSIGTASRAMTGSGRVAVATIDRVREVARQLGYQPNLIGQALRRGSSASVGMVLPGLHNPFYAGLVHAVEAALHQNGLQLIMSDSHADVDTERARLQLLLARRVDGLIVVPSLAEGSQPAIIEAAASVPTIQLDRRVTADVADSVGVDNEAGIRLLVDHLHDVGVRTLAFIGSDDATLTGRERYAVLLEATRERGIAVPFVYRRSFEPETGAEGVEKMLPLLPDAILCGDDLIALGVIKELRRAGISAPRDVLVSGFDGTAFAELSQPTLTTVEQPLALLAGTAVDALVSRIDGERSEPRAVRIRPRLRVRESTDRQSGSTD